MSHFIVSVVQGGSKKVPARGTRLFQGWGVKLPPEIDPESGPCGYHRVMTTAARFPRFEWPLMAPGAKFFLVTFFRISSMVQAHGFSMESRQDDSPTRSIFWQTSHSPCSVGRSKQLCCSILFCHFLSFPFLRLPGCQLVVDREISIKRGNNN